LVARRTLQLDDIPPGGLSLNMLSIGGEMSINVGHRHEPQKSAEQP